MSKGKLGLGSLTSQGSKPMSFCRDSQFLVRLVWKCIGREGWRVNVNEWSIWWENRFLNAKRLGLTNYDGGSRFRLSEKIPLVKSDMFGIISQRLRILGDERRETRARMRRGVILLSLEL
jgi:hypothetical protein